MNRSKLRSAFFDFMSFGFLHFFPTLVYRAATTLPDFTIVSKEVWHSSFPVCSCVAMMWRYFVRGFQRSLGDSNVTRLTSLRGANRRVGGTAHAQSTWSPHPQTRKPQISNNDGEHLVHSETRASRRFKQEERHRPKQEKKPTTEKQNRRQRTEYEKDTLGKRTRVQKTHSKKTRYTKRETKT